MKILNRYTVCYIKRNDSKILFLERNKKENDFQFGKFIGIGGKIEINETPEQCVIREVFEETGLKLIDYKYCGLVKYYYKYTYDEMYVYYCDDFVGSVKYCNEGTLHWLYYNDFLNKPHWKRDEIFLSKAVFGEEFGIYEFNYNSSK